MAVVNIFSKRQKTLRGEVPDVYTYGVLPHPLRVQIVHIIRDAMGTDYSGYKKSQSIFEFIHDTLCREYGKFQLVDYVDPKREAVFEYFLKEEDVERALDVVEMSFRAMRRVIDRNLAEYMKYTTARIEPDEAVSELNERFREHGVGYQFVSDVLIRVDTEFSHSEVIKPALNFLQDSNFQGANQEFLNAHDHYRHRRYKECLVECLRAFESTMKTICHLRGWQFDSGDSAKTLIEPHCVEHSAAGRSLPSTRIALLISLEGSTLFGTLV